MIVTVDRIGDEWRVREVDLGEAQVGGPIRDAIEVDDRIVDLWRRHLADPSPWRHSMEYVASWRDRIRRGSMPPSDVHRRLPSIQTIRSAMKIEVDECLRQVESKRWDHFWWLTKLAIEATIREEPNGATP